MRLHLWWKNKWIYLEVLITNFQYNPPPSSTLCWVPLYRSLKACWKSCNEALFSSWVTPLWMSLLSLKCSPLKVSFTFRKIKQIVSAKSGENGGCWITQIDLEARNCFTFTAQCAGMLSCNSIQVLFLNCSFLAQCTYVYKHSVAHK